jgi:hypothetical protein
MDYIWAPSTIEFWSSYNIKIKVSPTDLYFCLKSLLHLNIFDLLYFSIFIGETEKIIIIIHTF